MTEQKKFKLGQLLSVTTEQLLCSMTELYEILEYLTQQKLSTIGLAMVADACGKELKCQLPSLCEIVVKHINNDNWETEIIKLNEKWGEYCYIKPIEH